MDKQAQRTIALQGRMNISRQQSRDKSARIALQVQKSIQWDHVSTIYSYRALKQFNEVDVSWIEPYVYAVWPKVHIDVASNRKDSAPPIKKYDVIFVPIVAFDVSCNRLGYGGGWYDRLLAAQLNAITIGIAFDDQEVRSVLAEPHDYKLDMIITETRILTK